MKAEWQAMKVRQERKDATLGQDKSEREVHAWKRIAQGAPKVNLQGSRLDSARSKASDSSNKHREEKPFADCGGSVIRSADAIDGGPTNAVPGSTEPLPTQTFPCLCGCMPVCTSESRDEVVHV